MNLWITHAIVELDYHYFMHPQLDVTKKPKFNEIMSYILLGFYTRGQILKFRQSAFIKVINEN